jgi:hypothetical protein
VPSRSVSTATKLDVGTLGLGLPQHRTVRSYEGHSPGQRLSKTGQVHVTHTFHVTVSSPIVLVRGSKTRCRRPLMIGGFEALDRLGSKPKPSHSGRVAQVPCWFRTVRSLRELSAPSLAGWTDGGTKPREWCRNRSGALAIPLAVQSQRPAVGAPKTVRGFFGRFRALYQRTQRL